MRARLPAPSSQSLMTLPDPTAGIATANAAYDAALAAWRGSCHHRDPGDGISIPPYAAGCAGTDAYREASQAFRSQSHA